MSSDFALRPDKTVVLLQVRSTKLSVSSRRNAHFHKTACSPHRLVASRLANLAVLRLFGATFGPRLPQQKRQFCTRLSLILFSLIRERPQDLKSCKTIVFYKPKSPSGSKASCFRTFLCGPKKCFSGVGKRCFVLLVGRLRSLRPLDPLLAPLIANLTKLSCFYGQTCRRSSKMRAWRPFWGPTGPPPDPPPQA